MTKQTKMILVLSTFLNKTCLEFIYAVNKDVSKTTIACVTNLQDFNSIKLLRICLKGHNSKSSIYI